MRTLNYAEADIGSTTVVIVTTPPAAPASSVRPDKRAERMRSGENSTNRSKLKTVYMTYRRTDLQHCEILTTYSTVRVTQRMKPRRAQNHFPHFSLPLLFFFLCQPDST